MFIKLGNLHMINILLKFDYYYIQKNILIFNNNHNYNLKKIIIKNLKY